MKIKKFKIEPGENQIPITDGSEIINVSSPIDGEAFIYVKYTPGGLKRIRIIQCVRQNIQDGSQYLGTFHQYAGTETYHVFDCGNLTIK